MNPYISDLLAQPAALRNLLTDYSGRTLDDLAEQLRLGKFDRIIVTGMGSSFNAAYPGVIRLCGQSAPVQFVNAAELLHYLDGMIGNRSLLWMNSQSGRSAEIVHLLDHLRAPRPACILGYANDGSSPLALSADLWLNIHAGAESTVSTKTYINTVAANLLGAIQLTSGDLVAAMRDLLAAADAMEAYLGDWHAHVDELDSLLGQFDQLIFLGRGASMSAVWNGSLINKEAARCSFEGLHAAEFRHGPLELVSSGFAAIIFAGSPQTAALNRNLALEIASNGGRVLWTDFARDPDLTSLLLPETSEIARPLMEILPLQMLTLAMAKRKGLPAAQFRYVGKVTTHE
jgi:glutamine---fructose-6-phosphate transaminase (isomerizing)